MAVCNSMGQRRWTGRAWLAEALSAIDAWWRRRHAVVEYTRNSSCVFRLDIIRAARTLVLRDGTRLGPGERMARLHLWNEQVPPMPPGGPTIAWARRMRSAIAVSLRELARYLNSRADLDDVAVICSDANTGISSQSEQLARVMGRYGFEAIFEPENLPIGQRLHRLGENILISLFVLAFNPSALRRDSLKRVRLPIYLSRRVLDKEFGCLDELACGA